MPACARDDRHQRPIAFCILLVFGCVLPHGARVGAQTVWNVNGGGDWASSASWSNEMVPNGTADVIISTPDGVTAANVIADDEGGLTGTDVARSLTILSNGVNPPHTVTLGGNRRLRIIGGDIVNDGVILLNADLIPSGQVVSLNAQLTFMGSNLSLTGTGTLRMAELTGNGLNWFYNSEPNSQMTHGANHTIEGEGRIGGANSTLNVVNQGTIHANVGGGRLTIAPRNSFDPNDITFDNQSTVQASNGGILELAGGNYSGSGVYQALAGSSIVLNQATLRNTTIASAGDGFVIVDSGSPPLLDSVTNNADLRIAGGNRDLTLMGSLTNNATISTAESTSQFSEIVLTTNVMLSGGGTITLNENGRIRRNTSPVTLTNADNKIQGTGTIGGTNSQLSVVNQGMFDANVGGGRLTIDPRNSLDPDDITFDNQSTVQASNGGILELAGGNYSGSGVYQALAGSSIVLNQATLRNTTIASTGDGFVIVDSGSPPLLDSVTNNADLRIADGNRDLMLMDSLTNNATISTAESTNRFSEIVLINDVVLSGGGTITLNENGRIRRNSTPVTLTNADNRIQGTGTIGGTNSQLSVVNQGMIDANVGGGRLTIDPRNSLDPDDITFDNQSTAQASGGGTLELATGNYGGSGTYKALAGSTVLVKNVTVRDSTFDQEGTGEVIFSNTVVRDVSILGSSIVENAGDLDLHGTIKNSGSINLASTGRFTELVVAGDVTLTGGGTVNLPTTVDRVRAENDSTLTNADNTIQGVGVINAPLVNNGSIVGDPGSFIEINGFLSGVGTLENVRIDDVHAPGAGTAVVPLAGEYTIARSGELHLEIGGTTPGTEHDQLSSSGTVTLDGTAQIQFVNGFVPSPGNQFSVVSANAITRNPSFVVTGTSLPNGMKYKSFVAARPGGGQTLKVKVDHNGITPDVAAGLWSDAAVWGADDGGPPGANSAVFIDANGPSEITLAAGTNEAVQALSIGRNEIGAPRAQLNLGGTISVGGSVAVGSSGVVQGIGGTLKGTEQGAPQDFANFGTVRGRFDLFRANLVNKTSGTVDLSESMLQGPLINEGLLKLKDTGHAGSFVNRGTATLSGAFTQSSVPSFASTLENHGNLFFQSGNQLINDLKNKQGGTVTLTNSFLRIERELTNTGRLFAEVSSISKARHDQFFRDVLIRNVGSEIYGDLTVEGSIAGGMTSLISPGLPVGEITVLGNYIDEGTLEIELGGVTPVAQYDRLSVGLTATNSGTVRIELIDLTDPENNSDPFAPELGQLFDVLIADEINLTEADIDLPTLDGGLSWLLGIVPIEGGLEALRLQVIAGLDADFDTDGDVDSDDFLTWRNNFGLVMNATSAQGDYDSDGDIDGDDFLGWQAEFDQRDGDAGLASVPEPASAACVLIFAAIPMSWRGRRY